MGERTEELKQLRERLDFLQKIETQEDFDEGARLHNEKNAPWKNGQYSHLEGKYEPYVYRPYPRMLYNAAYEPACLAYEEALRIPARGSEEGARQHAIAAALKAKTDATCIVQNLTDEAAKRTRGWYLSPTDAVAATKAELDARHLAQAHREYEDRNMGDQAKAEMRAHDDAAGDFTPEIPAQTLRRKPGRKPKKQQTEVTV